MGFATMKLEENLPVPNSELGRLTVRSTDFFAEHGTKLAWGAAALALGLIAFLVWSSSRLSESSQAWTDSMFAENVEQWSLAADRHPGSHAAHLARLSEAEQLLISGTGDMLQKPDLARRDWKQSQEAFERLLNVPGIRPEVRERALLGLATVLECLSDGNTSPAIERFQQFVKEFPKSIDRPYAEGRIAALESGRGKDFYAWFSKREPTPVSLPRPKDGKPAQDGDSGFDPFLNLPSGPTPKDAAPKETTPAAATDSATPATETPAVETPAASETPAAPTEPAAPAEPASPAAPTGDAPAAP